MKESPGRRSFLKTLGIGGITATVAPTDLLKHKKGLKDSADTPLKDVFNSDAPGRPFNGVYKNEYLTRLAFPIGGLGAGMFCLEGTGAISHMSVRNKPDVFNEPGLFAAICVKDLQYGAKVLEGPAPDWKKFGRPDSGNGSGGTIYGLPRFHSAEFETRFPFGLISLADKDMPLKVKIEGWSPFIPGDADNSGLPCGALEYSFTNTGTKTIQSVFSFNSRNFMAAGDVKNSIKKIKNGFVLSCDGTKEKPQLQGDVAIYTDQGETMIDHCWFRGGWFDPLTITWETIRSGNVKSVEPVDEGAPGASLYVPFALMPGHEKKIRLILAWYVPNTDIHIGEDVKQDENSDVPAGQCFTSADLGDAIADKNYTSGNYKPWYSKRFADIYEVADYWKQHYDELQKKSTLFKEAFYASTLPAEVTEAVAANLTILKSPTVMRQYDGRLWSFEGCGDNEGCCHGSCTHVWNYAQAIPHLFPLLERTLRHTEFCEDQNAEGHQTFRASLPSFIKFTICNFCSIYATIRYCFVSIFCNKFTIFNLDKDKILLLCFAVHKN